MNSPDRVTAENRFGIALLLFCLLAFAPGAWGYLVGPPLSLEELEAEADLIIKGEAIASEPVEDEWFKPVSGYGVRETRFRVISTIKGGDAPKEIRFRHYDEAKGMGRMYTPQFYHFEPGRSYIVCAYKTPTGARQTRSHHTMKMDLGVLRCSDHRAVPAKTLRDIYWEELIALRDSPAPADVVYAIQQCQEMSEGPDRTYKSDFSRLDVLHAMRSLISRPEPDIAQAAIRLIGDGSPYLSDVTAPYWLGTVGMPNPGLAQMNPDLRNAGGALCWRELAAIANSNAPPETRALAIRALGLVKTGDLRKLAYDWLKAPEVPVRSAAVLLFTDFATPHPYTTEQFAGFAKDPAPEVRKSAAYAIGFMQSPENVPILSTLLRDEDKLVRQAARESLHSFRAEIPAVSAALQADLGNSRTHPLSLLALARNDPGPHLEALAQVIKDKPTPTDWTGGEIPAFTAWKLVFRYLRSKPAAEMRSGKWDAYLDALEQVGEYSSSEPRDIYALYLQRGMSERAAKYRAKVKKERSYDMDYYFDMVDKNPATYEGP
jgi:HEAT repeat protein